jgi:hypothetical protein
MSYEIINKVKGPSYIRFEGAGTYTITLPELRANTAYEANVNTAVVTEFGWSTSGNVSIQRGGSVLFNVFGSGMFNDKTQSMSNVGANNKTSSIVINVTTAGSGMITLKKEVTYNVSQPMIGL